MLPMTKISNIAVVAGPQQTAQRDEVRAILAALIIEPPPLQIRSDAKYAVDILQSLLRGSSLPFDGERIDLWRQIHLHLATRTHPVSIVWVKGHVSQDQIDSGIFSQLDKHGNDAADQAAVQGAATHACPANLVKLFQFHCQNATQVALMYVQIASALATCEANERSYLCHCIALHASGGDRPF